LERYARNRSWTLGVLLANILLLLVQALSPARTAGAERFWVR
jgi:hypothetical protein